MRKIQLVYLLCLVFSFTLLIQADIHASISNTYIYDNTVVKTGKASWYSEQDPGINERTANNEVFDDTGLTAAMWGVPFNQEIKVTNLENGKSVVVRINDRGPHKRYVREGRIIDLTKRAFGDIAELEKGLIRIQLEYM